MTVFFKAVSGSDFSIREATKGAFTQARTKLNPWAFERLNEVASETFYEGAEYYVWHGMRTLAVDGTRLVLPNHPSIVEEFGQHQFGPNADSPRSLAMDSLLYDVLNQITTDGKLAPYSSSERNMTIKILSNCIITTGTKGEAYKLLKSRAELEDFSGKTARAVKQDFLSKVFLMTLCAAYAHPIEEKVVAEYRGTKSANTHKK